MNELIMPHNVGVKNALENMNEVLALYKKVIGNYRPLLDGERYLTDKEVAQMKAIASRGNDKGLDDWLDNQDVCQMLNISPRTLQTLRDNGTLAYSQINRKVYYKPEDVERILYVVAGRGKESKMCNLKTSRL